MMSLLRKDPLVMAHSTGSSREALNPTAFSAFTARSSPKIPAVFLPATLVMTATSSMMRAMSSSSAKNPVAMPRIYFSGRTRPVRYTVSPWKMTPRMGPTPVQRASPHRRCTTSSVTVSPSIAAFHSAPSMPMPRARFR